VEVAAQKYLDHLQLERQARIMKREGLAVNDAARDRESPDSFFASGGGAAWYRHCALYHGVDETLGQAQYSQLLLSYFRFPIPPKTLHPITWPSELCGYSTISFYEVQTWFMKDGGTKMEIYSMRGFTLTANGNSLPFLLPGLPIGI
jgi:hypothetical protein